MGVRRRHSRTSDSVLSAWYARQTQRSASTGLIEAPAPSAAAPTPCAAAVACGGAAAGLLGLGGGGAAAAVATCLSYSR